MPLDSQISSHGCSATCSVSAAAWAATAHMFFHTLADVIGVAPSMASHT